MTDPLEGWVTATAAAVQAVPEPEDVEDMLPTGPTEPEDGLPSPDLVDQLPRKQVPSRTRGRHWYIPAHGGAGATTLSTLDPDGRYIAAWPYHQDGQNVVVVSRETVQGLTAACSLATQWRSGGAPTVHMLALITIPAQPGKLTLPILEQLNIAAGVFPRHYRSEWHPAYMDHLDPADAPLSKRDRRIINTIRKISTKEG